MKPVSKFKECERMGSVFPVKRTLFFVALSLILICPQHARAERSASAPAVSAATMESTKSVLKSYSEAGYKTWRPEEPGKHPFSYKRFIGLLGVLLIMFLVLYYDAKEWKKGIGKGAGERDAGERPVSPPKTKLVFDVVFAAFLLLIFISKYKDNPWQISDSLGYLTFPGEIKGIAGFLRYVMGDVGLPVIPYRALLTVLVIPRSMVLLRCIVFALAAATLAATYLIAWRRIRPQLAWIPPVLLFGYRIFNYGLEDLRGYMFFTFFTVLSVWAFLEGMRRPRPAILFVWVTAHFVAFMSNPLIIAVAAGPAFYYLFAARKAFSAQERCLVDLHFGAIAAGAVCFVPFIYRAVGASHIVQYQQQPYIGIHFLTYYNAFWLVCAVIFFAGALMYRSEIRGAIFLSASAGTAVTLLVLALGILEPYDHYLLFVMPLNFICIGLLAEAAFGRFEKMNARAAGAAALAAGSIFIAAAGWFWTQKAFFTMGNREKLFRAIALIDERVALRKTPETPVYIYPYDYFVYYLTTVNHLNIFDRNPLTNNGFGFVYGWKDLPSGDQIMTARSYYTTFPFFVDPAKIFTGPYWAVVHVQKGEKDPFESIGAKCEVSELYVDVGILIRFCTSSKK